MKTFSLALISVGVMSLAHSLDVSGALARLGLVTLGTVLVWAGLDHFCCKGNEHETD
jgi:hypothetical protein